MADVVKIIFDADLDPLNEKVADAKRKVDEFIQDSESRVRGIKGVGDSVGSNVLDAANKFKTTEASTAATTALGAETAAEVGLANATQVATVASTEQAAANLGVAASSEAAAGAMATETAAAGSLTAALGAATAAEVALIATVGALAAAGVGLILYAEKDKELAEQRLQIEENLAISANKRIQSVKEEVDDYKKIVENLREAVALSDRLSHLVGGNDSQTIKALRDKTAQDNEAKAAEIGRLKADLRTEQDSLEFERNRPVRQGLLTELGIQKEYSLSTKRSNERTAENNIEETKKQIAEVEAELKTGITNLTQYEKALRDITANRDKVLSDNFHNTLRNLEADRRLAEEQNAKFVQSVKEANAEVERRVKGYKATFENLFVGTVVDNPFAQRMLENARSVETLKDKLAGAGPELKKTALGLLETANATKTFSLQINSAFEAIDFRSQADRFRNPTQRELQSDFQARQIEQARTSNSTNPDVLKQNLTEAVKLGLISAQQAFQRFAVSSPGLGPDAYRDFATTLSFIRTYEQDKKQQVLESKLDVASRAKTDAEKAIADRAVINYASNLNPDELNRGDRSKIADAFERAAIRNETRQEEALSVQKDLLKTLQAIDKRGEALAGIANTEGKTGIDKAVKFDITLKDDTSDKKVTASSATASDVADTYQFPIAGAGGTNL